MISRYADDSVKRKTVNENKITVSKREKQMHFNDATVDVWWSQILARTHNYYLASLDCPTLMTNRFDAF